MKARALVVIVLIVLGWATFTAALFAMWWSVVLGAIGLATIVALRGRPLTLLGAAVVSTPLVLVQVALPEFAEGLDEISCRVRAAHGESPPRCGTVDVDVSTNGPLLSTRQHLAIRWFNLHMAAGGYLTGYGEVAWETLQLDVQASAEHQRALQREPIRKRRRMCRDGAADGGPSLERESDFAMDARVTRETARRLQARLRDGQHRWFRLGFPGSYAHHPWHVVLALWVPDSTLHARRDGERLDMWWEGDLHYPLYVIDSVRLPRLIGGNYDLAMDEAVFCGLQMDGVWRPFRMKWHWRMERDDPRLEELVDERRTFERVFSLSY